MRRARWTAPRRVVIAICCFLASVQQSGAQSSATDGSRTAEVLFGECTCIPDTRVAHCTGQIGLVFLKGELRCLAPKIRVQERRLPIPNPWKADPVDGSMPKHDDY